MATSVSQRLNVQDYSVGYNNAVFSIICESWYFTYEKYLHGRIKSLSQESERSCICVLGYQFDLFVLFGYLILELFRQCGIFCISFLLTGQTMKTSLVISFGTGLPCLFIITASET